MTLEHFAALMEGLGYKAERGERVKVKPVTEVVPGADAAESAPVEGDTPVADAGDATAVPEAAEPSAPEPAPEETAAAPIIADVPPEGTVPETPAEEIAPGTAPDAAAADPEMEVFYSFTWGGFAKRQGNRPPRGAKPGGKPGGKPRGKPTKGKRPPKDGGNKGRSFESRPPKKDKIDPDNPFAAALMGLKDKS